MRGIRCARNDSAAGGAGADAIQGSDATLGTGRDRRGGYGGAGPGSRLLAAYEEPLPAAMRPHALAYQRSGEPVQSGPHPYPEMAAAGLWTLRAATYQISPLDPVDQSSLEPG
jgi:hypothetical protein